MKQFTITLLTLALALAICGALPAEDSLETFDRPFLFSYLSWQYKAVTKDGVAVLRGVNNQGGAGLNGEWNVADAVERLPVLRLKVGAANQTAVRVLMLKDDGKGEGRWEFPLPAAATKEFINVWPREGASLAEPNVAGDDGPPNLAKLRQVQLMGDWAGGKPLDLEVDAVLLLPPTEGVLAARAEKKKRLAAEEQARHEAQSALLKRYGTRSNKSPTIEHVSAVAADVLAVEIQAGTLVPAALVKYEPQAGDKKQEQKNDAGDVEVLLQRNGKTIGWLIGPNHDWLTPWEEITGDPLLDFIADDPATFSVRSSDDVALQGPATPLAVGRKSHVNAWAQGPGTVAVRHTVYLKLPKRLTPGKSYSLNVGSLNTQQQDVKLDFDPTHIRSEAVHVNQIGYRPNDPVKQAFVSCWLGTGGVLELRTQK